MTPDSQPQHCDHECVCLEYRGSEPCCGVWIPQESEYHKCKHDTRPNTIPPAPDITPEVDAIVFMAHNNDKRGIANFLSKTTTHMNVTMVASPDPARCKKCESESCCEACQIYLTNRDAQVAKAEREQVIKEACEQCPLQDETPDTCENCLIHKICSPKKSPRAQQQQGVSEG